MARRLEAGGSVTPYCVCAPVDTFGLGFALGMVTCAVLTGLMLHMMKLLFSRMDEGEGGEDDD